MKNKKRIGTILLAGLFLASGGSKAMAQETKEATCSSPKYEEAYDVVETMPEYPGGFPALMEYIQKNLRYPTESHKAGEQGKVLVQFIIAKDGTPGSFCILRSPFDLLSGEAIRALAGMPKWKPGMQKGEAVAVKFVVPIIFNLDNQENKSIDKIEEVAVVGYGEPGKESSNLNDEPIFEQVEQMPQYSGGSYALMQYLSKNIKYPVTAQKDKMQGRVSVEFIVDKEGYIRSPKVARSVSSDLDAEAIRVISSMPKWTPGTQRGKAVNVKYTIPIVFRLNTEPVKKVQ